MPSLQNRWYGYLLGNKSAHFYAFAGSNNRNVHISVPTFTSNSVNIWKSIVYIMLFLRELFLSCLYHFSTTFIQYYVTVPNPKVTNVKAPNVKVPTRTSNCRPFKLSNCQIVDVIKCRTYLACSLTPPNLAALFSDKHRLRGVFIEVRCPLLRWRT
jgi:hypothetical protein